VSLPISREDFYPGTAFRWSKNAYQTQHLWISLDNPEVIDGIERVLERICEENFKSEKHHFIIKNRVFGGSFA
jgi:hypothetical protein